MAGVETGGLEESLAAEARYLERVLSDVVDLRRYKLCRIVALVIFVFFWFFTCLFSYYKMAPDVSDVFRVVTAMDPDRANFLSTTLPHVVDNRCKSSSCHAYIVVTKSTAQGHAKWPYVTDGNGHFGVCVSADEIAAFNLSAQKISKRYIPANPGNKDLWRHPYWRYDGAPINKGFTTVGTNRVPVNHNFHNPCAQTHSHVDRVYTFYYRNVFVACLSDVDSPAWILHNSMFVITIMLVLACIYNPYMSGVVNMRQATRHYEAVAAEEHLPSSADPAKRTCNESFCFMSAFWWVEGGHAIYEIFDVWVLRWWAKSLCSNAHKMKAYSKLDLPESFSFACLATYPEKLDKVLDTMFSLAGGDTCVDTLKLDLQTRMDATQRYLHMHQKIGKALVMLQSFGYVIISFHVIMVVLAPMFSIPKVVWVIKKYANAAYDILCLVFIVLMTGRFLFKNIQDSYIPGLRDAIPLEVDMLQQLTSVIDLLIVFGLDKFAGFIGG